MNIRLNTEHKQVILENGESVKLSDIFNFLHTVDPDNAGDWTIVAQTGGTFLPYVAPYTPPAYPNEWEITCSNGDCTCSDPTALEGIAILTVSQN